MLRLFKLRHLIVGALVVFFGAAALLWPAGGEEAPRRVAAAIEDVSPIGEPLLAPGKTYRPERVNFAVQVKDAVVPYRVLGLFVMPGEAVPLEALLAPPAARFTAQAEAGTLVETGPAQWQWTAPEEPGLYRLAVTNEATGAQMLFNAFVKTPYDPADARIGGYRIGQYQKKLLRGDSAYARPEGFVKLTRENRDVRVAPHFTLGQFQCKQGGGYPKYLLLEERLLLKLEIILEAVNERGIPAQTLHVMSAFRTPWYNRSIGNRTEYSRHLYGGAADVFVDTDGDGVMDDLTGDGRTAVADARFLAALVEEQTGEAWYAPFVGGLGVYDAAPHRGPFIHVDVRGRPARW